jgi:hypothetical protein
LETSSFKISLSYAEAGLFSLLHEENKNALRRNIKRIFSFIEDHIPSAAVFRKMNQAAGFDCLLFTINPTIGKLYNSFSKIHLILIGALAPKK